MENDLVHIVKTDQTNRWGIAVPLQLEFLKPAVIPEGMSALSNHTIIGTGCGQLIGDFMQDPLEGATLDLPLYLKNDPVPAARIFGSIDRVVKAILTDFFKDASRLAPTLKITFTDKSRTKVKCARFWVSGEPTDHPFWSP